MFGTPQARASLEITWPIMRKHRFDSSQSHGFVAFSLKRELGLTVGIFARKFVVSIFI